MPNARSATKMIGQCPRSFLVIPKAVLTQKQRPKPHSTEASPPARSTSARTSATEAYRAAPAVTSGTRNRPAKSFAASLHQQIATRPTAPRGARRIATLARSGQQACAGTCALRHHSRHNSAPALPPPSDDVRWGQSTPASSLIAREARPLAAASDLRRRLDRRWPRWRPT